ncbi:hypothetical protein [Actinopolyspora lacussalsi]|uniref:hypothetical protein n=1 Tax=Actinopolyspora righensis TaxID=995060 RepID=UPI001587EBD2|nr:hypothetical protein [Actinopolyspora righensis]
MEHPKDSGQVALDAQHAIEGTNGVEAPRDRAQHTVQSLDIPNPGHLFPQRFRVGKGTSEQNHLIGPGGDMKKRFVTPPADNPGTSGNVSQHSRVLPVQFGNE